MPTNYLLILVLSIVLIPFVIGFVFTKIYVRCPSNQILAVQGWVAGGRTVMCYHGGAHLVLPLLQEARFLDLTPMTIEIPLKGALSHQNIRVNVPSTFTIAIDNSPEAMTNAAVRLLDLSRDDIERMASEIILGQLRLTIASLTIEEINSNRERFLDEIRRNIQPELRKIGLELLNVNITDITDESGYIESIGKKASSTAINQAKIEVAEQVKLGDIGQAEAEKERRIRVASANADAIRGENESRAQVAAYNASLAEQEAEAQRKTQMAQAEAQAKISAAQAASEENRLVTLQLVPKEIEKRQIAIEADALAEKLRREAMGRADAIISVKAAEAEGILKVLDAKAAGYRSLISAAKDNAKDAATLLLVEKLEQLVTMQTDAIKNLKIDKITVWDGGNSEKGSATANFVSSMAKTLPPLHEVAGMAGIDLPRFLGGVTSDATPESGE